jgi:hypothetical protein
VVEPLKRIYKASQAKKEKSSPWVPKGFVFLSPGTRECFQKLSNLCNRMILLTAFVFALFLPVPVFTSGRSPSAVTTTIYASS